MIEIKIGQIWRASQLVTNLEYPLFIQKSSGAPGDSAYLVHQQITLDDKVIIKSIKHDSIWSYSFDIQYFMVTIVYDSEEYQITNVFLHKYFIIDDPDLQEAT